MQPVPNVAMLAVMHVCIQVLSIIFESCSLSHNSVQIIKLVTN